MAKVLITLLLIVYLSFSQSIEGTYRIVSFNSEPSRENNLVIISGTEVRVMGCNMMWGPYSF